MNRILNESWLSASAKIIFRISLNNNVSVELPVIGDHLTLSWPNGYVISKTDDKRYTCVMQRPCSFNSIAPCCATSHNQKIYWLTFVDGYTLWQCNDTIMVYGLLGVKLLPVPVDIFLLEASYFNWWLPSSIHIFWVTQFHFVRSHCLYIRLFNILRWRQKATFCSRNFQMQWMKMCLFYSNFIEICCQCPN